MKLLGHPPLATALTYACSGGQATSAYQLNLAGLAGPRPTPCGSSHTARKVHQSSPPPHIPFTRLPTPHHHHRSQQQPYQRSTIPFPRISTLTTLHSTLIFSTHSHPSIPPHEYNPIDPTHPALAGYIRLPHSQRHPVHRSAVGWVSTTASFAAHITMVAVSMLPTPSPQPPWEPAQPPAHMLLKEWK